MALFLQLPSSLNFQYATSQARPMSVSANFLVLLTFLSGLLDTPQRDMFTYVVSSPQIILELSYFIENICDLERFKGIVLRELRWVEC
jgi:hypothetical protein